MKFDKKVMESGVVAAFSFVLAFSAVNVTAEAVPDSRTVELIAELERSADRYEIPTITKRRNEMVMAALSQRQINESHKQKEAGKTDKSSQAAKTEKSANKNQTEKMQKTESVAEKESEQKPQEVSGDNEEQNLETAKQKEPKQKLEDAGQEKAEQNAQETDKKEIEPEESENAQEAPEQENESAQEEEKELAFEAAEEEKELASNAEEEENKLAETQMQEVSPWADKLMPNVDEYLNIRTEASEEAELAGKLHKGAAADIVERGDGWTKIRSGSVEGYVRNDFCVTGAEAEALAEQLGTTYATAVTGGVRVRETASAEEETKILDVLEEGGKIKVDKEAEAVEGWVSVKVDDQIGYVSADYVTVDLELGKAISIEEEQAAIAAAEEERRAKEAAQQGGGTQQKEAAAASYDDVTLLGALIQCEAGSECYEGQLAVGAVVMNRLRAGYAGSISGVIYQSGQFTPASSGALAGVLASGVSGSCMQAAQQAIGGADNVNGATSFRRAGSAEGLVIGNHVFF